MPRALWTIAKGHVELREASLGEGIEITTEFSGISRGTEALVLAGSVPESEWSRMACPLQSGSFPFPVKYGYAAVGRTPESARVFCLHPHQDRFTAPAEMLIPIPDPIPSERAILAANMETALNIVWDAEVAPGDKVAVIGAGVVGALTAWLAARIPGTKVTLIDINPDRITLAKTLGCNFTLPENAPENCDICIHTSASSAGLTKAIACAGFEAKIIEASWYGDRATPTPLGGAFHSQRLQIKASQVGHVPPARRARWTYRRRMETALSLLAASELDALISGETEFSALPTRYPDILADPGTLCHRIKY